MKTENQPNPSREEIDTGRLFAEMLKFFAEREKLRAETEKMGTEAKWHPVWVAAGLLAAGAALAKIFL